MAEVTQQSKARHKEDFLQAFSPSIAEATALAYKGASPDIQAKLRRVVDVWKDRNIFEREVQEAMEARLDGASQELHDSYLYQLTNTVIELDKTRSTTKVGGFGGPIFGAAASTSIPAELTSLVAPQQAVSKCAPSLKGAAASAETEYQRLIDATSTVPAPAVHAARLTGLLKTLATAEGAVSECIKARKELLLALEKLLHSNRESLVGEERQLEQLSDRRKWAENEKKNVELAIIGGLPSNSKEQTPTNHSPGSPVPEPDRPQVEALTPPHVQDHEDFYNNSPGPRNGESHDIPVLSSTAPAPHQNTFPSAPGIEMLSNLASQYQAVPVNEAKKRKIANSDDFPDLGGDDGIEADVAEMLRKDNVA